jgi:hypothetical protein
LKLKNSKYIFLLLVISLSFCNNNSIAQVAYEPAYKTSYEYLTRMSQRGLIELDDVVLPLSRYVVYQKLTLLYIQRDKLTPLEWNELQFYLKDFYFDRNFIDTTKQEKYGTRFLKWKIDDRLRPFASIKKNYALNIQPILGGRFQNIAGSTNFKRTTGFAMYGYLHKRVGFGFSFTENNENGQTIDKTRAFSPETGFLGTKSAKSIQYSEVKTNTTYNWNWGQFTVGQDQIQWGYGYRGKLVLSDKAPNYPFMRLDLKINENISFNMTNMWLSSFVIDSSQVRPTSTNTNQIDFVPKYLSTHSFNIKVTRGLNFAFGESIIYNNRLKLGYLLPLSFFRAQSHYDGELGKTNTVSNSQFFLLLNSRNLIPRTQLFFQFFVDEMSFSKFFNKDLMRNQTGYQVGFNIYNFPIRNLTLLTDYTRIRPLAYVHFIPAQTYASGGYLLGSWIGPNADQWISSMQYRIIRGLKISGDFSIVRKGDVGDGYLQQSERGTKFLYGTQNIFNTFSGKLDFEITHDLFLRARVDFQNQQRYRYSANSKSWIINLSYGI